MGVILLAGIIILAANFAKNNRKTKVKIINIDDSLIAIGGKDNIISHSLSGSRINLVLKDYSLVDREKLKSAGATGFILKSDKLTIVFKDNAEKVYKDLFK